MSDNKEMMVVTADKIADMTGYKSAEIAVIKKTIAKDTTDTELAYFLSVCRSVDLNPFIKEIWCYKDVKGNVLVFAGRDGFLKIGQRDTRWNGMTSAYVCENDEFSMDIPAGVVTHKFGAKDRGAIVGSYAIIKPKGCENATVEWAEMKEYNKGYNAWKSNPASMIMKVAETHALKKAFGISGLQSEYDFEVKNDIALPVQDAREISEIDEIKAKVVEAIDAYQGEDKEQIQTACADAAKSGQFTIEFGNETLKKLGHAKN